MTIAVGGSGGKGGFSYVRNGGDGAAGGNASGAAIFNDGTLTLQHSTVSGNRAVGGKGGEGNRGRDIGGQGGPGGGARGGGIASAGTLTVLHTTVKANFAQASEGGTGGRSEHSGDGGTGGAAGGGGIFSSDSVSITDSKLADNEARSGVGGAGGPGSPGGAQDGGDGGDAGDAFGGAVDNAGASASIRRSTVSDNQAISELGGAGGRSPEGTDGLDGFGGPGTGGGVGNTGTLKLSDSTIAGNVATGRGEEGAGVGGGIVNVGELNVVNATVTGNRADAPGEEGSSDGGGVASGADGRLTVDFSTVFANRAQGALNLSNRDNATASLRGTIVAGLTKQAGSQNCSRPIDSDGSNLEDGDTCGFGAFHDIVNTDPQLGDLRDNGGPTMTLAPAFTSPVLNAASERACPPPSSDQRGFGRPSGLMCDIGAVELQGAISGHRGRVVASVNPRHAVAGERTCFHFKATSESGAPLKNARIKLSGKRRQTNARGRARICKVFHHPGVRHPRIKKPGFKKDKLRIGVR